MPLQVLKAAGIQHPYYTDFLGEVHERYRVVDRNILLKPDGEAVPDWARAKQVDPVVNDYRLLQYDMMFGTQRGGKRFFPETRASFVAGSYF